MNPRERYIETLTFGTPDRVPFQPGGPRESTLARWHAEGLPEQGHWMEHLAEAIGIGREIRAERNRAGRPVALGVDFRMIPQFEEKVLSHENGHYVVRDWKGNVCEISDRYDVSYLRQAKDFVTRRWIRCPVETRADWEAMKRRYAVDTPGRFPDDFARRCEQARDRDWILRIAFPGPFWQMREWCGFEPLCMMMIEQPDFVAEMAAFWNDFVTALLDRILERITPDSVFISEDMAYKGAAMISPAMVREFCMPSWRRWTGRLREAGCPLVDMDSDGFVGELVPLWIEAGINVCDPIEVAAHNDIVALRRRHGRQMAYRMGVDKRAMARGGTAIRDELDRLAPVVRDGGYIPGCDHGVPADVSWPAFVDYARLLAEITAWR